MISPLLIRMANPATSSCPDTATVHSFGKVGKTESMAAALRLCFSATMVCHDFCGDIFCRDQLQRLHRVSSPPGAGCNFHSNSPASRITWEAGTPTLKLPSRYPPVLGRPWRYSSHSSVRHCDGASAPHRRLRCKNSHQLLTSGRPERFTGQSGSSLQPEHGYIRPAVTAWRAILC